MGEGQFVKLDVVRTMGQIMVITVIPVSLGMFLKSKRPTLAMKAERPVKIASAVFIALVILGAIFKDKENVIPFFQQTGLPALVLNVITLI
ncbi:MAG: hypothetical protein P5692_26555, partial [Limnospira sp. PMC 1280.21]|nr:hypothetical protein [Limnospira sp. PMC 1280.21]